MNGNLHTLFHYSIGRLTRKEAREALGVDDVRLTQLLRMAGFPAPRSPKAEEDDQVEFGCRIGNRTQDHWESDTLCDPYVIFGE